jgi:hypothetical protein
MGNVGSGSVQSEDRRPWSPWVLRIKWERHWQLCHRSRHVIPQVCGPVLLLKESVSNINCEI